MPIRLPCTAAIAALVFMDLNGVEITAPKDSVYEITMAVATGQTGKAEVAAFFRSHAH